MSARCERYLVEHQYQSRLGQEFVLTYCREELQRVVDPICPRIFVEILHPSRANEKRRESNAVALTWSNALIGARKMIAVAVCGQMKGS